MPMPKMQLHILLVYRGNETIAKHENSIITAKKDFKNMGRLGSTHCHTLPRL
jgi:hypothetical protein